MLGRRVKAGALLVAVVVLLVEGFLVYRWYDRHHAPDVAASDGGASETVAREATAAEGTAEDGDTPPDAAFVHRAADANSRGDYTYLADPRVDGDPDAVALVSSSEGAGGGGYSRNVGVWYEPRARRWAIFNQDRSAVPAGTAFEVVVPPADRAFVHRAAEENTAGNATYLDDPLTNGRPGAEVSVTQNWNPGGGNGVYNDHPVGVLYDKDVRRWLVYNEDDARMPEGAAFNVAVSG